MFKLTNSDIQVIQKLIERISPERLGFVQAFRGNVYDLSTHPYGCRVLQRRFEHLPEEQTRPLLDELHKYTTNLMQDQFGVSIHIVTIWQTIGPDYYFIRITLFSLSWRKGLCKIAFRLSPGFVARCCRWQDISSRLTSARRH